LYDDHPYLTSPCPSCPPSASSSPGAYPDLPLDQRDLDRLTHLVLVDGRLVEVWSEPVSGTRWQEHADRFDRELRRPTPEPTPPVHERALAWLDGLSGSREATLALDATPLVDDGRDLPEAPSRQAQSRLAAVAELLDAVGRQWFDAETTCAFRAALLAVWDREPEVVLDAASAAHVAGGICWAVGKANGLYRPQGGPTMGRIKEALALHVTISTYGRVVERALVGYRDLTSSGWWRPAELPDLLPLGHPDLLLGEVRARLVRIRQRALEAQGTSAA
jgi:hypothetical protein